SAIGQEAIVAHKKMSIVEISQQKFWKIWNFASYIAQALERMSVEPIYRLPRLNMYNPFKRKDRIIHYNINSWNDSLSDVNDIMANIIIKHIKNAYNTLFTESKEKNIAGAFSHTNYLLNKTNINSSYQQGGTFN